MKTRTITSSRCVSASRSSLPHSSLPPSSRSFRTSISFGIEERLPILIQLHPQVEPARRAYDTLGVKAAITGRRRTQGADRATLQPLEIDSTGLVKVNPLCTWGFQEVKDYIDMAGVPYNPLLDQGYKSVGDWHSTVLPKEGESERSGRWASNKTKTECGLHKVRLLPHLSRAQPRR
jgi:phosphoadenylyl-sulfate reductase (thioredoxin)